jgi:hypothetical protein
MTAAAQIAIVLCVAVVSGVLVWTLVAVRRTAVKAEHVLSAVERDLRPMLGQIESLTTDLRQLAATANLEVQRIGAVARRLEEFSTIASRVFGTVGGFTRVGQYASLASGLRRGLDEFLKRLKTNR